MQTTECDAAPSPLICSIIKNAEQEKLRDENERQARVQAAIAAAKQAANNQLGSLTPELSPLITKSVYETNNRGEFAWLRIELDAEKLATLELASFNIHVEKANGWNREESEFHVTLCEVRQYQPYSLSATDAAAFLYEMHKRFIANRAEIRKEIIERCAKLLDINGYSSGRAQTRAQAEQAYREALTVDIQHQDEWKLRYSAMLEHFKNREAEAETKRLENEANKAARAAEKQKRDALESEYRAAYELYWNSQVEAVKENLKRVAALQARADAEQFHVFDLEYGILATGDDGERAVETRSVYVLQDHADSTYYPVLRRGGEVARVSYANVVSIEECGLWKPSAHRTFAQRIVYDGYVLYLSPLDPRRAEYENMLRNAIQCAGVPKPESGELSPYGDHDGFGTNYIENVIQERNPEPRKGNATYED